MRLSLEGRDIRCKHEVWKHDNSGSLSYYFVPGTCPSSLCVFMHLIPACEVGIAAVLIVLLGKLKHKEAWWLVQKHSTNRWWSQNLNSSSGLAQELPTCILHAASCWWGYGIGVWQGVGRQEPDRSLEIGAQLGWVYCMIRRLGFILHVAQRHQWLISKKKIKSNQYFREMVLVEDYFGVGMKRESVRRAVK